MASAYLVKVGVHFLELLLLNCYENAVFSFKNTYNKKKGPFFFKSNIFFVFGGCPYFLNKALDTQSAFTCSKLTIETIEQDVKYVLS